MVPSTSRPPGGLRKPAQLHTAIIGDVAEMWSKLRWNADQFRELQISYPDEPQPLAYAAINVCIAATSLRDWVRTSLIRQARANGKSLNGAAVETAIHTAIPQQPMCEAIANTAKHSAHDDGAWGGEVQLAWEDGDEDSPPGYILRHLAPDGLGQAFAANEFHDLLDHWQRFLLAHGLITEAQRTPSWELRKWRAIFGEPAINAPHD